MSIHLPAPIDLYVKSENAGDANALSECFAADATVHDEHHTYRGLAAIREWKVEAKRKYGHTVTPVDVTEQDGKTILKARLTGNFPGSPVTLNYSFVLESGKIVSLDIR
jgi:hypothetical protein